TAAVEDDYDQAVAFAKFGKTPCFLIRHPWNRSRETAADVHWVDSWPELTERLLALASTAEPSTAHDGGRPSGSSLRQGRRSGREQVRAVAAPSAPKIWPPPSPQWPPLRRVVIRPTRRLQRPPSAIDSAQTERRTRQPRPRT